MKVGSRIILANVDKGYKNNSLSSPPKVQSHFLLEEYESAIKEAKILTQQKPTHPLGFYLLGKGHASLFHHREATQAFLDGIHSCVMTDQPFQRSQIVKALVDLVASFAAFDEPQSAALAQRDDEFERLALLGTCCHQRGLHRHALLILGNVKTIFAKFADQPRYQKTFAQLLLTLGQVYQALNKPKNAESAFEKCEKLAQNLNDIGLIFDVETELAAANKSAGNEADRIAALLRVVDCYYETRASPSSPSSSEAISRGKLGLVHRELAESFLGAGNLSRARQEARRFDFYRRQAVEEEKEEAVGVGREADYLMIMGRIEEAAENMKEAEGFYRKAISKEEEKEDDQRIRTMLSLCRVLLSQGEVSKVKVILDELETRLRSMENAKELILMLTGILVEVGDHERVRDLFHHLRDNYHEELGRRDLFHIVDAKAEMFAREGRIEHAKYYAEEALQLAETMKEGCWKRKAKYSLARVLKEFEQRGIREKAEKMLKSVVVEDYEAIRDGFQCGNISSEKALKEFWQIFNDIQEVYVNLGQYDHALLYGEIAKLTRSEMGTLKEYWPHARTPEQEASRWTMDSLVDCVGRLQRPCVTYSMVSKDTLYAWFISAHGSVAFHQYSEPDLEEKLSRLIKNVSKVKIEDEAALEIRVPLGRMLDGTPEDDKLFKHKLQPKIPHGGDDEGFFGDESSVELFDFLLRPFDDLLEALSANETLFIVPDTVLTACPFGALKCQTRGLFLADTCHVIVLPYLHLSQHLQSNEKKREEGKHAIKSLRDISTTAQIQHSYKQSKKPSTDPIRRNKTPPSTEPATINPKRTSNPRLMSTMRNTQSFLPEPREPSGGRNQLDPLSKTQESAKESERKGGTFRNPSILDDKKSISSSLPSSPEVVPSAAYSRSDSIERIYSGMKIHQDLMNEALQKITQDRERSAATKILEPPSATIPTPAGFLTKPTEELKRVNFIATAKRIEWLMGLDNISTLTKQTATDTDIVKSVRNIHRYGQVSDNQVAVVIANPVLPQQVYLAQRIWEPLGQLEQAQNEAKEVSKFFHIHAITGEMATKDACISSIQGATVLHIATIGSFEEGFLVFSPNRYRPEKGIPEETSYVLHASEISRLNICAKLVVISGCLKRASSSSLDYRLPLSFLHAGASLVLVQKWPIPGAAALKYFRAFYAAFEQKTPIKRAARHAAETLRADRRYAAPFYWAAFECIGFDGELCLKEIKAAMLDQTIDKMETKFLSCLDGKKKEYLNARTTDEKKGITTRESFLVQLQEHLRTLFRDAGENPPAFDQLISLVETADKMVEKGPRDSFDVQFQSRRGEGQDGEDYGETSENSNNNNSNNNNNNKTGVCGRRYPPSKPGPQSRLAEEEREIHLLPRGVGDSAASVAILHLLGFAFQPRWAHADKPYVVFPSRDRDRLLHMFTRALRATKVIADSANARFAFYRLLPMENQVIGELIALLEPSLSDRCES